MTWANRITILRILLIPVFVSLLVYYHASRNADGIPDDRLRLWAAAVFVFAALSDALDGYLARHWNQRSPLGSILDPVADKLLMLASLITLSLIPIGGKAVFPLWFPLIVISRDAVLLIGFFLLHFVTRNVKVAPYPSGKAATFFQLLAIASALLLVPGTIYWCYLAAGLTLVSTCLYVADGIHQANHSGFGHARPVPPKKRTKH